MNQTSEDPQVHAHLGLVRIPAGSCCEGQRWEEYTPEAAIKLISDILLARLEAEYQLRAIAKACAEGHAWTDGWNHVMDGDKVTMRSCTREGCDGRRIDPGWLPFEPKQHLVPYSSKLWDCTGPGCEWCGNESIADHFRNVLTAAIPHLGVALGGPEPTEPLVVRKVGHTWSVDAAPEQVQAALDARNAGNRRWSPTLPVIENPNIPDGYAVIGDWTNYADPESTGVGTEDTTP